MDSTARCFTGRLRDFCLWRDQVCRIAGGRIAEVDHRHEAQAQGPTTGPQRTERRQAVAPDQGPSRHHRPDRRGLTARPRPGSAVGAGPACGQRARAGLEHAHRSPLHQHTTAGTRPGGSPRPAGVARPARRTAGVQGVRHRVRSDGWPGQEGAILCVRLTVLPSGSSTWATRSPHGMSFGGPSTRPPCPSTSSRAVDVGHLDAQTASAAPSRHGVADGNQAKVAVADRQPHEEDRTVRGEAHRLHGAEKPGVEMEQAVEVRSREYGLDGRGHVALLRFGRPDRWPVASVDRSSGVNSSPAAAS